VVDGGHDLDKKEKENDPKHKDRRYMFKDLMYIKRVSDSFQPLSGMVKESKLHTTRPCHIIISPHQPQSSPSAFLE